ncbi:MAG: sensor histidine kinase [Lachnospiraceae bacterium]|nr:sensor histidine kinase [Lachnospiraceae bacterium]
MNIKQYLKNQLPVIVLNIVGMTLLSIFLWVGGNKVESILLIVLFWLLTLSCYVGVKCFKRKKYLDELLGLTEQLEERYLIIELMNIPEKADDQVFYKILKMTEKSMLENIDLIHKERNEYKEYIEQWMHEIKTPITAIKLICENNSYEFTRQLLVELERINIFTEQALYYTRSEHTERDYFIHEVLLDKIVHEAIADNKYLLRQNDVEIKVDDIDHIVYTDNKWIRFILNQLISNAVKYRNGQLILHFYAEQIDDKVCLFVEDNGIGISESDLPRIFEKGFTGQNGRIIQNATGIGLYLCKKLADKLGIGIDVFSNSNGTSVKLSFHINDLIVQVQE